MKVYRQAKTEFKIHFYSMRLYGSLRNWAFHYWDAPIGTGFRMYGLRILGIEFSWFYIPALMA